MNWLTPEANEEILYRKAKLAVISPSLQSLEDYTNQLRIMRHHHGMFGAYELDHPATLLHRAGKLEITL